MKTVKKAANKIRAVSTFALGAVLSSQVWAEEADPLAPMLGGKIKAMFGSSATFWKIYILIDIIFAGAACIKTKSPMVFLGVFVLALIPGFLIDLFVFPK